MKDAMEKKRWLDLDARMNEAATKIQRAFRRKKEGKSMIMHIKDVMKKLMEAEKAKSKLVDMLSVMQDETMRFWHSYLAKNVEVKDNKVKRNIENYQNIGILQGEEGEEYSWEDVEEEIEAD